VIAELLVACPALRIVATSREPLRIAGESEFDLAPMNEPDAIALFIERAQAVRADVGDSPAVNELVRPLDGLPLAVELAAARTKLLRPDQILERIALRLDLLKGGRDADERHVTLRATIAWSYDLLDDDERQLFARLAVFRDGWTLDAAEAVCDADLDTLASLLDKSLIRRRTADNGDERLFMLETIRDFARERLVATGQEEALRRRQLEWLIELADRAGTRATVGVPGTWDVGLIAPDVENVRAALDWATSSEPERGLVLAAYLEGFWIVRETADGAMWLEDTLRIFRELGLRRGEAIVLAFLAEMPREESDLQTAIELTVESATIAHELEWPWWEAGALGDAATLELERGNIDAAERHYLPT
jgi:predicted ATPase